MNIETTKITTPITEDNLPKGPLWDEDGACFSAEKCEISVYGVPWRWVPKNGKAFGKGEPDKEMHDFYPALIEEPLGG